MPQEGQTTIAVPTYVWEKAVDHLEKRKTQLRRKGDKVAYKVDYSFGFREIC